jgi:hypothetical protein
VFLKNFINILMDYLTNYYKNLSEQLQEKVNYLEKMLKEGFNDPKIPHDAASREYADDLNREFSDIAQGEEDTDNHNKIAALIARHHADVAPHIARNLGTSNYDPKLSEKHLYKTLTTDKNFTTEPFTSVEHALDKIGGQFLPPVIHPQKGNKHWGDESVIELDFGSGEIHPHAEERVLNKIKGSIYKELKNK